MATIGSIEQYDESRGDFVTYMARVKLFFTANGVEEGRQVPTFLTLIGPKTYQLLTDLMSPDHPKDKTLAEIETTLKKHLNPTPLVIAERFRFHQRRQGENEPIKDFVASLKALASTCQFGEFLNDALRDKFVCGLKDSSTQKKLLTEASLTFVRAIEIATSNETASKDAGQLKSKDHAIHGIKIQGMIRSCKYCGRDHKRGQCPAYGDTCSKCKRQNHWASKCLDGKYRHRKPHKSPSRRCKSPGPKENSERKSSSPTPKKIHNVSMADDQLLENLVISTASLSSEKPKQLKAVLKVQHSRAELHVQIDSGAEANILPTRCFAQLYPEHTNADGTVDPLSPLLTPRPLSTISLYGGRAIQHYGTTDIKCHTDDMPERTIRFFVCETNGPILLGLEDSCNMQLIQYNKTSVTIAVLNKTPTAPIKR